MQVLELLLEMILRSYIKICPLQIFLQCFYSDLTSDMSNVTKDNFSAEVQEDKSERIFFCSTIAYDRNLTLSYAHCFVLISLLRNRL